MGITGPIIVPPLPSGHIFVVTSYLMIKLTSKGLFDGLPSKDVYAYIRKAICMCRSSVYKPDVDMKTIRLCVSHYNLLLIVTKCVSL